MTARSNLAVLDGFRIARAPRLQASASGNYVVDLATLPSFDVRMADYEQAFGLPSALHQHSLPLVATRRGFERLRMLVQRRLRA